MMTRFKLLHCIVAAFLSAVALVPQAGEAGSKKARPVTAASVFDAEKRKKTNHEFGQRLSYSIYSSIRFQSEHNRRRDDATNDQTNEFAIYAGFVGRVDLGRRLIAFGHGELDARTKTTQDRTYDSAPRWNTKEAFVSLELSEAARLTIGRMRFSDANKWVADAAVDGIHYGHKTKHRVTELAAFAGTHDVTASYLMAHHGRASKNKRLGALALIENDGSENSLHLSAYSSEKVSQRFAYEWNIGVLSGDGANGRSSGFGFDVHTTHKFGKSKLNPQLVLGFAMGSEGYRQSGIQSNKTYNYGQAQVHRYGYAYQPDLSNLAVGSLVVGLRPSRKLSVDLGVHNYRQVSASSVGPMARVSGVTTGTDTFLGNEISLVGAWRPTKKSKVEFGVGHFKPGRAYVDRSAATRVYMRLSVTF
ncbi:MAG: alginate export family protein [Aliishimia sp.]